MANINWDELFTAQPEEEDDHHRRRKPAAWKRWLVSAAMFGSHVTLLGGFLVWQGIIPLTPRSVQVRAVPKPSIIKPPAKPFQPAPVAKPKPTIRPVAFPPKPAPVKVIEEPPPSPAEIIQSKGLSRRGLVFVADEEQFVNKARKEAETAYQSCIELMAFAETINVFDANLADAKLRRIALNAQVEEMRITVDMIPYPRWRNSEQQKMVDAFNQARRELNELNSQINLWQTQLPTPAQRQNAAGVGQALAHFDDRIKHLGEMLTSVKNSYSELGKDKDVRQAIGQLEEQERKQLKLGPSEDVQIAQRVYERLKAERTGTIARAKKPKSKPK